MSVSATISHSLSATTPDDPGFEIQPKHWNSAHIATFALDAAGSEISNAFTNGGGVSFGLSANGRLSATVQTNYLTTAALSNHSHGNPTLALTNITGTTASASNGLTLSLSGEAAQTVQTQNFIAAIVSGANGNGTFTSGTLSFKAGNNITLSTGANVVSIHAPAPGAAAENNALELLGANTAGNTTVSGSTLGLSGINITLSGTNDSRLVISGNPAQTVQTQNFVAVIGSGANGNGTFTSGTLSLKAGNNITLSTGANVISVHGVAAQTEQTQNLFAAIVSGANGNLTQTNGTLSFKAGNNITLSTGANVFSIHGVAAQTVQSAIEGFGVSNVGNTAGDTGISTGIDWVLRGSGSITLSQETAAGRATVHIQHPAWLTTAALSNHSHGDPTLALTNLTGTTASNSAGFTLSLSANAPGAAAENNHHNLLGANTAGNTTASGSTIGLSGINLTLSGTNDSVINISAPATSSIVGTNGISIHTNGSTISVSLQAVTLSGYAPYDEGVKVAGQHGQGTWHVQPLQVPNFQFDRAILEVVWSNSSNSTGSATISNWIGIYTKNASTLSLLSSTSTTHGITFSGTQGNFSLQHGNRNLTIPWTMTISEGNYWVGIANRTTTGGGNGSFSQMCVSDANSNFSGVFGVASNATLQRRLGLGVYTASSSQVPGSIGFNQINGTASMAQRQPSIVFHSGTA